MDDAGEYGCLCAVQAKRQGCTYRPRELEEARSLDLDGSRAWLDECVRACHSGDPEDTTRLFSREAVYYPGPFAKPHRGRAIVEHWTVGSRFKGRASNLQGGAGGRFSGRRRGACFLPRGPARSGCEYSSILVLRFDKRGRFTE